MKAELKAKWIAALRGGDYKQAMGKLRANTHIEYVPLPEEAGEAVVDLMPGGVRHFNGVTVKRPLAIGDPLVAYKEVDGVGHCCLGVLADIVNPDGWTRDEYEDTEEGETIVDQDSAWYHAMGNSDDLLFDPASVGLDESLMNDLATLNDNGNPFTVIADLIEKTESV